jgi:serine/threonine-protein kinase
VPRALDDVVQRALAKDPEGRFRNAGEFAAALVPFGGRNIALDDEPSDSFTFEVWQIRQRDSRKRGTRPSIELPPHTFPPPDSAPPPQRPTVRPGPPLVQGIAPIARPDPARIEQARRERERAEAADRQRAEQPRADRQRAEQPRAEQPRAAQQRPAGPRPPPRAGSIPPPRMPPPMPTAPDRTIRMPALDGLGHPVPLPPAVAASAAPPSFDDATAMDEPTLWLDRAHTPRAPRGEPLEPSAPVARPRPEGERYHPRIGETGVSHIDEATQVSLLVRGRLLLASLRFVARRFGERSVKEVLDTLDPHARRVFDEGVDPERWYTGDLLTVLAERIDAVRGRDDLHVIVELGRALAESAFEEMRRLKPPSPPVELLLSELPRITGGMIQGAETALRRIGRGYARIELVERSGTSLTLAVLVLGFVERALGRFGAAEVEVNLVSSRALDDAETLLDVSWIA